MNYIEKNNILFLSVLSVLRGPWFFVFLVVVFFVGCSKTPTDTDNTKQLTVPTSIAENTTWTFGTDYMVENEECGVFEFCRFEGLT
ncbi:MAG: hypothetical protein R6V04_03020 [bacterium]